MATSIQAEEIDALKAIYDQDFVQAEGAQTSFSIQIRSEDSVPSLELNVSMPVDYPEHSPPVFELKTEQAHIVDKLQSIFRDCNGDVVVYQWVEWIRDYMKTKEEGRDHKPNEGDSKELPDFSWEDQTGADFSFTNATPTTTPNLSSSGLASLDCELEIVHGEPLTDRKSTFQAHVAEVHSVEQVKAMLAHLKTSKKIASATHNILAYRIYVSSGGVFQQDCDDDGEAAAGGRLLHLLQIMDAQNIAVVVTRWYGGILLHADRFKHINNVARIAIQDSGLGLKHQSPKRSQDKSSSKKKRTKSKQ